VQFPIPNVNELLAIRRPSGIELSQDAAQAARRTTYNGLSPKLAQRIFHETAYQEFTASAKCPSRMWLRSFGAQGGPDPLASR
jgi:hypothetical protein